MVSHECVETQIQGGTTGIETVRLYPPLTEQNLSRAGILMYKLFENADMLVAREARVRDFLRFRRQQV